MSHGAAFFTFYIVLVHATCAWLPLPRIPRDISATSRTMYSMRGLHRPKLSLRFDSNEENIAITRRTTKDSSKLGRASKRSVQQPSKVSTVESGQSNFFPWVDRKSNEMSVSTVPAVSDSTRMDADDAQRSLPNSIVAGLIAIIVGGVIASNYFDNVSVSAISDGIVSAFHDPTATLNGVVETVESMGPNGVIYFGIAYTIAEVLAIPAIPLTASAGYIFGPVEGTTVVLLSASIAASISFVIGRTLLRDYVEKTLQDFPKFAKIDKAIGKEGFKLMVLLRMSPVFPFALSNYLYGASSINFTAYFWGTLLGFAPGTIAYVCTGAFGKALQLGGDSTYPWYVYAGGLTVLGGFIKVLADTAVRVVDEIEDEEDS